MSKRISRPVSSYNFNQKRNLHINGRPASAKDIFEACNRKRDLEFQKLKSWEEIADSFKKNELQAKIYSHLSSTHKLGTLSINEIEAKKVNLEMRKNKLRQLLKEDERKYRAELECKSKKSYESKSRVYPEVEALKLQLDQLKKKNEEERQKMAEKLSFEIWKKNNPDLRQAESDRLNKYVQDAWVDQKLWKEDEKRKYDEERKKEAIENEKARQEELEARKLAEEERIKQIADKKKALDEQNSILREQKILEHKLNKEVFKLEKEQELLQKIASNRQHEIMECRKRKDLESFWARQHQLKLKKKSLSIQEELMADEKTVEDLIESFSHDNTKANCMQEVNWMRGVLMEQRKLEKLREKEYELLFSEEAEKMWNKRQAEWTREQEARDKLMSDVIQTIEKQIQDNMNARQMSINESKTTQMVAESSIGSLEKSIAGQNTSMEHIPPVMEQPRKSSVSFMPTDQKSHEKRIEDHKKEIKMLEQQMEHLWNKSYVPPQHGRKKVTW